MKISRYIIEQILCGSLLLSLGFCATQQHHTTGLVLKVDRAQRSLTVSCQEIPGFMHSMTMPIRVRDAKELSGIGPGTTIEFEMSFHDNTGYGESIKVSRYQNLEQDPLTASRLRFLNRLIAVPAAKPVLRGEVVPDFTLIDQSRHRISLSEFIGKVVAINFIYTSCALPQYCYRSTNNFGVLQRRFQGRLGRELILLTVTFDPARDQPDVLAQYASRWKADTANWHFLTGADPEIHRVTAIFGVDFFPSEGLMDHSLHTAIVDRHGKLVANIEGNQFTAEQFADLVESTLDD